MRLQQALPPHLDEILLIDQACGLNHTFIEQDGTVHGFLAHWPEPWPKATPPLDGKVEVLAGDQAMFRLNTMDEARAYLYGVLMGFCGGDIDALLSRLTELKDATPLEQSRELHKMGWCPVWESIRK